MDRQRGREGDRERKERERERIWKTWRKRQTRGWKMLTQTSVKS